MTITTRKSGRSRSGWRPWGIAALSISILSVVSLSQTVTPASGVVATNGPSLAGAGSSFAAPAITAWLATATHSPYNLPMTYVPSNSGTGRYEFTNQTVNWAVSDIGYVGASDSTPPSFPFNFIPITAGGIAFMYDVPGLSKRLQLTSYTACALLTGGITNWDSSYIAADNPGVALPNLAVVPVTESDSAGTNYVLEEWCIDEQPGLWKSFVAAQEAQSGGVTGGVPLSATAPESNWPGVAGGIDDQDTTSVAKDVADNNGTIGPVQVQYAADDGFNGSNPAQNVALVQNASGDYTGPTPVYDVSSALAYATQLPDGTHQLDFNGVGPNVYNPSTYSYLLTPTTGWPAADGATMSQFVDYALSLGQKAAPSFGYASLGLSLEQYGVAAVQANVPGAVAPTATEQQAYSCGDLTPSEVAAGKTTPTCGIVTSTAAPPSADSGTATGSPVTSPASGVAATGTTAAGGKGTTTTTSKTSTGVSTKASSAGKTSADGGDAATSDGVDAAVSLAAPVSAMPNTGINPIPLSLLGGFLLVVGSIGRRRISGRRRSAAK
jgi:phosphate transport system substrate-binding protein